MQSCAFTVRSRWLNAWVHVVLRDFFWDMINIAVIIPIRKKIQSVQSLISAVNCLQYTIHTCVGLTATTSGLCIHETLPFISCNVWVFLQFLCHHFCWAYVFVKDVTSGALAKVANYWQICLLGFRPKKEKWWNLTEYLQTFLAGKLRHMNYLFSLSLLLSCHLGHSHK